MVLAVTLPPASTKTPRAIRQHLELPAPEYAASASTFVSITEFTSRPPDQLYYWLPEWQSDEAAARADILAGRITTLNTPDEVDAHFGSLTGRSRKRRRRRA